MRLFTDFFRAMSVAVAFAEEGELETAISIEKASRVNDMKFLQSRVRKPDKYVRKPAMRV